MAKRNARSDQLIYATFRDDVAFSIREMKAFIRNGGTLNLDQITAILDKLYVNIANELVEEGVDEDRIISTLIRAESYLESAQMKFVEIPLYADVIDSQDDEGIETNINEGYIQINGEEYPLVEEGNYFALKRAGIQRRGRTITSYSELAQYVGEIPAVYGIQIVYNVTGIIVGYRVYVADRTD